MKIPRREEGQGLVEYALVLALVALALILILTLLGNAVVVTYAKVIGGLHGQAVNGAGAEYIILSLDATSVGGLSCTVNVSDAAVVALNNGELVQEGSVTLNYTVNGNPQTLTVAVDSSGIDHTGAFSFSGACPITMQTPYGFSQTWR